MKFFVLLVFLCAENGQCDFYKLPGELNSPTECRVETAKIIVGVRIDPDWYRKGLLRDTTGPLMPMFELCLVEVVPAPR